MNAQRDVRAAEAVAVRYITPRSLLIFGLIALVVFAYCEGKRSVRVEARASDYAKQRHILVDSASAVNDSENAHTVELIERRDDATKARAVHAKAAARLVPASETTIRIDGGEPQTMVPANLVVPEIKAAHAALVSDSLALLAAAATLGFATTRADLNEQRAEAAEGELKASKPSRWRFVGGFLVGVASIVLLRKALK
jgi:hypothetical protein